MKHLNPEIFDIFLFPLKIEATIFLLLTQELLIIFFYLSKTMTGEILHRVPFRREEEMLLVRFSTGTGQQPQ